MARYQWALTRMAAVAALFGAASCTPDTVPAEMRAKYGVGSSYAEVSPGYAIHYRDQGCRDCPAVLMIHGLGASLHTWQPVTDRLSDRFRIVSLDLPGHGLTGPHPKADYTQAGAEQAIEAVLAATGVTQFALVGSSLGGGVAWEYALDHPVDALILLDPIGAPPTPNETPRDLNTGFRIMSIPVIRNLITVITPRSIVKTSLLQTVTVKKVVTEEMVDRYWELLRYPGNRRAAIDRADTDQGEAEFPRLKHLTVPTLLIWGKKDTLIPVDRAVQFEGTLPDVSVAIYKGIGHLPMEEDAERTARDIANFLMEHRPLN